LIDTDHSGSIELHEMWEFVKNMDMLFTYEQLKQEFEYMDVDNSKSIEFDEFRKLMNTQYSKINDDDGSPNTNNDTSTSASCIARLQHVFSNESVFSPNRTINEKNTVDENKESNFFSFQASDNNNNNNNNKNIDDNNKSNNKNRTPIISRENSNNINNKNDNNIDFTTITQKEILTMDNKKIVLLIESILKGDSQYSQNIINQNITGNNIFSLTRKNWNNIGIKNKLTQTAILKTLQNIKTR